MLDVSWTTLRLFLHVLAATVWVGGQLTLAGLVPTLRGLDPEAPGVAARRFNQLAWPAFGVLIATGIWNLVAVDVTGTSSAYQVTLMIKLLVVAAAGIGAFLHSIATTRAGLAGWGAVSGLASIVALFLGVLLH